MQTRLADFIRDTREGRIAEEILRKCVHCGFCTATCPTYQLLGDELDGPRGRIYLIKEVLEGGPVSAKTQLHLDRCLTCRSCETTCPSGVQYTRLLDIGRHVVEQRVPRSSVETAKRTALRRMLPQPLIFETALRAGQWMRPFLPAVLRRKVPAAAPARRPWPTRVHERKMLVLDGCVQPGLTPATNVATARMLDRLGITLVRVREAACCGALALHLDGQDEALDHARRNIDAWWRHIERGAEGIVITASGCCATVKDYPFLLGGERLYADKARRIAELTRDVSEVVLAEEKRLRELLAGGSPHRARTKLAFHAPCTLQHGLKMTGKVEALLRNFGFELTSVRDPHLCCGSAGTYSLLQPELSQKLLANKLAALTAGSPAEILTANVGCQTHLQSGTRLPVRHWIEAIDDLLSR